MGTHPPKLWGIFPSWSCSPGRFFPTYWTWCFQNPRALCCVFAKVQGDVALESCLFIVHFPTEVSAFSVAHKAGEEEDATQKHCQSLSRTPLSLRKHKRCHTVDLTAQPIALRGLILECWLHFQLMVIRGGKSVCRKAQGVRPAPGVKWGPGYLRCMARASHGGADSGPSTRPSWPSWGQNDTRPEPFTQRRLSDKGLSRTLQGRLVASQKYQVPGCFIALSGCNPGFTGGPARE